MLEAAFALYEYPSAEQRRALAAVLEVSAHQVYKWFWNRRQRRPADETPVSTLVGGRRLAALERAISDEVVEAALQAMEAAEQAHHRLGNHRLPHRIAPASPLRPRRRGPARPRRDSSAPQEKLVEQKAAKEAAAAAARREKEVSEVPTRRSACRTESRPPPPSARAAAAMPRHSGTPPHRR